jgi:hypothetical protein
VRALVVVVVVQHLLAFVAPGVAEPGQHQPRIHLSLIESVLDFAKQPLDVLDE